MSDAFVTLWTLPHQAPLSMGFPKQEYWSGLPFPSPEFLGLPGGLDGKESACYAGDLGLIPGLGRSPGGGYSNPLQYYCLENPRGQRGLASCSPWGRKESDITERLSPAQHKSE